MDIAENEEGYQLQVEVPGLSKEDVHLEVLDGALVLSGEKREESESEKENFSHRERRYGSFRREVALPSMADASKIEANMKDGVLTIAIPKKAEAKPRQIEIAVK